MSLPNYLRKPKHKQTVVATKLGWVVAETGELLVRVKDLDKKLAEYLGIESVVFNAKDAVIEVVDDKQAEAGDELEELVKQVEAGEQAEPEEAPVVEKKRRGRPKATNKV